MMADKTHPFDEGRETKEQRPTRRAFIWGMAVAVYLYYKVEHLVDEMAANYSDLLRPAPVLPDGSSSRKCRDWLTKIFDGIDKYSVVPGFANADFPHGPKGVLSGGTVLS